MKIDSLVIFKEMTWSLIKKNYNVKSENNLESLAIWKCSEKILNFNKYIRTGNWSQGVIDLLSLVDSDAKGT